MLQLGLSVHLVTHFEPGILAAERKPTKTTNLNFLRQVPHKSSLELVNSAERIVAVNRPGRLLGTRSVLKVDILKIRHTYNLETVESQNTREQIMARFRSFRCSTPGCSWEPTKPEIVIINESQTPSAFDVEVVIRLGGGRPSLSWLRTNWYRPTNKGLLTAQLPQLSQEIHPHSTACESRSCLLLRFVLLPSHRSKRASGPRNARPFNSSSPPRTHLLPYKISSLLNHSLAITSQRCQGTENTASDSEYYVMPTLDDTDTA